jgi:hypothetical protein
MGDWSRDFFCQQIATVVATYGRDWQNSSRCEVNSHERDCDASGFHFLSQYYGYFMGQTESFVMSSEFTKRKSLAWSASFLLQSPILMAKISRKHPKTPCKTYRLSTGSFVESCLADFQEADWEGPGTEETLVLYVFFFNIYHINNTASL